MDDVPAGPASPGPRRPLLSVVIPVYNGGRDFEHCLRRLRDSDLANFELIVVDDGSTDGSAALAESFGASVVRHQVPLGPAAARNLGARAATAPLVFFLDADVAVHPETLSRALARFSGNSELAALFGSYDATPSAPGLVSQFRNLLHHFVHQQGDFVADARPARTFWTGCGAIRRQVFLDLGGFDPRLYRRPAIEDIEFGYRLTRAGFPVILARDIQATHMKRWSLTGMVKTDIFQRGVPWMLLMNRSGIVETDLNVRSDQKICVAMAGLICLAIAASPLWPVALASVIPALFAIVGLNFGFYRFLARERGWAFAIAAIPLHYLYYCCCGISVIIALALWKLSLRNASRAETPSAAAGEVRKDPARGKNVPRPKTSWAWRPSRWIRR